MPRSLLTVLPRPTEADGADADADKLARPSNAADLRTLAARVAAAALELGIDIPEVD